jgi:hypothetical protein
MINHIQFAKQTPRWLQVYGLFQIQAPLNFLTVPSRMNVKFHYLLTGPKVETLNTFSPLVATDLRLFSRAVTRMNPYTRPTSFL